MTQQNPANDPAPDSSGTPATSGGAKRPQPAVRRKAGWLRKVLLGVVIIVVILLIIVGVVPML